MKTKNNVQKTILRTVAVILSFVLISFTVSAQEFWNKLITNSSFNEIAVAMIETEATNLPEKSGKVTVNSIAREMVYEPALELENWMISDSYFNGFNLELKAEKDNPLQVEEWMLNESNFNVNVNEEEPLELESWMVGKAHWNS